MTIWGKNAVSDLFSYSIFSTFPTQFCRLRGRLKKFPQMSLPLSATVCSISYICWFKFKIGNVTVIAHRCYHPFQCSSCLALFSFLPLYFHSSHYFFYRHKNKFVLFFLTICKQKAQTNKRFFNRFGAYKKHRNTKFSIKLWWINLGKKLFLFSCHQNELTHIVIFLSTCVSVFVSGFKSKSSQAKLWILLKNSNQCWIPNRFFFRWNSIFFLYICCQLYQHCNTKYRWEKKTPCSRLWAIYFDRSNSKTVVHIVTR